MAAITQNELTAYDPTQAASIVAGPTALYTVNVNSIDPTQLNEGFTEVDTKANAFDDITSAAALQSALLGDIEPVVIGPNGQLYITDGHHTFTALLDSSWGASNPTVDVNVIANYSSDTLPQFYAALAAGNLEYPVTDGVVQTPSAAAQTAQGAFGTSLTGLTSDPYRGLEYSILKNKLSKLFTTNSDLTGAVGSAVPGLDKTAAFYADFIYADAYRDANGGKGLPYLSPGDILVSTAWNENGANITTLPGIGTISVSQLPGYILPTGASISISGVISNATLANGTLDGSKTGTLTSATASFNGLRALNVGPSTIGSNAPGFVLQLGGDDGATVTLTGANTYTGGTTILAGTLVIGSDAALGAAGTTGAISSNAIVAGVEADNGVIFDSLTEGNGTIMLSANLAESRAIVLESEVASFNLNGFTLALSSPLYSAGALSDGLSNAAAEAAITVEDTSSGSKGVLTLSPTANNSNFYGNWVITSGTLAVSSDASLGSTTGSPELIGQIDLNGGTLQAGASFTSVRSLFLGGGSTYDTDGYATVWQGNMQDVQRTLLVINSSATAAGSVAFGTFEVSATATLNVEASSSGKTDAVTFTGGIVRDTAGALLLQDLTGTLGTNAFVYDTSTGAGASTALTDGIAAPWIAVQTATSPTYGFVTYGSAGYVAATASSTSLAAATASSTVAQGAAVTLTKAAAAYALTLGSTITTAGNTITLGNGIYAGLILNGSASLGTSTTAAGVLATGTAELDAWLGGKSGTPNTIDAQITGSGGIDFNGAGTVNINTASTETGTVTVDSGVVGLGAANAFAGAAAVNLSNVKSAPSPATLTITASQTFKSLNSVGTNSVINFSNGAALTIGDSSNANSAISSTITEIGTPASGSLTKAGTGLLDLSGGKVTLVTGSTVQVNAGVLRGGNGVFGTQTSLVRVAGGAELQYSGNGGSQLSLMISGNGAFHLISGTVQILGTLATGTNTALELGTTLDLTTAVFAGADTSITDAGGIVDFDQTTSGTYIGVISDGFEAGGANDPLDMVATSGIAEQGELIKDDSTSDMAGNVTLSNAQTFTGATYVEAGTLTLGAVNTLATSSGVTLGRVGGGATAVLALGANNQVTGLSDTAGNTDSVTLGSYTMTLAEAFGVSDGFGGVISGSGALIKSGAGTQTLTGASTFTGGLTLDSGALVLANASAAGTGAIKFNGTATLDIAAGDAPANSITGFTGADTIDLLGVGTETAAAYNPASGTLTLSGGASGVSLTIAVPAHDDFTVASDGSGGTLLGLAAVAAPVLATPAGTFFSNAAIPLTGTGTAGDGVTVYDGTAIVGSGTVSAGGVLTASANPGLPLGSGTLTATETDANGVSSVAGNGVTIYVNQGISGALTGGVTLTTPLTAIASTGKLTNTAGVAINDPAGTGSQVTNAGSVYGSSAGVTLASGSSLTNTGSIASASGGTGVSLSGNASLTNAASGQISGGAYSIYSASAAAVITNAGTISATNGGVYLAAGGTVTNQAAGTITGYYAVYATNGTLSVSNAGSISGSVTGVYLNNGSVNNTGTITGAAYGVYASGNATVVNSGSISGGDAGVVLGGGGTLVNSGTIGVTDGYSAALHGASDLLVIAPGAVFKGDVVATGGGARSIELTSGAATGTIGNIGSATGTAFTGFNTVLVDAGANWVLAGSSPLVFLGGGGDTLTVGSAASVRITAGVGADTVNLGSGLAILSEARDSTAGDTINGFTSSDLIHFTGFGAGATVTALGGNAYQVGTAANTETLTVNGASLAPRNYTIG